MHALPSSYQLCDWLANSVWASRRFRLEFRLIVVVGVKSGW